MKTATLSVIVILAGMAMAVDVPVSNADQVVTSTSSRLESVGKLIERSSAARQVEASANADAKARREQARALHQQAAAAEKDGQYEEAEQLLKQATQAMFAAARMAEPQEVVADKQERDFEKRVESINALLEAHDRVARVKGAQAANKELRQHVEDKLNEAEALRNRGKLVEARKHVDEAYVTAKVAIERLRGGDTLVRSLKFETRQEEYRYEVDRNDTHRMLVEVLLTEKMNDNDGVEKLVQQFMDKATKTRAQAEEQAARGDYETAITTMEESTKEIVRAIRSAGIYIPG